MGLTSMAVLGVGSLMVTLTLNMIVGWSFDTASCPGTDAFCDGVYWQTVVQHLPTWLYIAQILVVLALASPFALVRTGGR